METPVAVLASSGITMNQSGLDFTNCFPKNPRITVASTGTVASTQGRLEMIPDTSYTSHELSDGVSEPNCIPEVIYTGHDVYLNAGYLDDNSLDQYLYFPSIRDDDFYQGDVNDDQYFYNFIAEPYQDVTAAVREAKLKVGDDVVQNNALSGESGCEIMCVKGEHNVYNEHAYIVKVGDDDDVVNVEVQEEVFEETFAPQNAVVKIEAPAVKRPVGRPRKTPLTTKPVKRSAAHFDEETYEEIVDVESFDVKRPREAPEAKPAPRPSAKKAPAQKRKVSKPNISIEDSHSPSHFQAIDTWNPNGYVMRQAKTSALKKINATKIIAKSKKSPTVSRSKRSDHNDMEKKRRDEMRDLFESLKKLVPTALLVDDNNKIKKNPSKNTILVGTTKYVKMFYENKKNTNSSVMKNQKLQEEHMQLAKALIKRRKKLLSRRNVCL